MLIEIPESKNEGGKPMTQDWLTHELNKSEKALEKLQGDYEKLQGTISTMETDYKAKMDELRSKPLLTPEHIKALKELEGFRSGINHFIPGQMVKIIEGCPDCQERLTKDDVRRLMKLVNIHEAPTSIKISREALKKLRG